MKLDSISEMTLEQIQTIYNEYSDDIELLVGRINELVRTLKNITDRNISLSDNIACEVKTLTVKGGITIEFAKTNMNQVRQISVGRVKTSGSNPTSAVQVLDWSSSTNSVRISNIVGLTNGQSYDITLTLYF